MTYATPQKFLNVSRSVVAKNFKRERGDIIFTFFQAHSFFGRSNLKLIEKQEKLLGGSGGMLPRNIFENLQAVRLF